MQNTINRLIQDGQLNQALSVVTEQLKQEPSNHELRSSFIELLCIDGQLERADQQLDLIVKQAPEMLPGVVNLRQIVRAAQARLDFAEGGDTAATIGKPGESFSALLKLRVALRENNADEVENCAQRMEQNRDNASLKVNGLHRYLIRDVDDTLAGFVEMFGTNGKYYLIPISEVSNLEMLPAESLFELIWRKAKVEISSGDCGEVFVPLTYVASHSEAEKLARETDWQKVLNTDVYQGRGRKLWLVDDGAMELFELKSILRSETVEAID
jgi:type VI secretion system protein ImpE